MSNYIVQNKWKGYRHKEDQTNMEPGILVVGSQNVLLNEGERVALRQGYTLDGSAGTSGQSIESSFDWVRHLGDERHLRVYLDTDTGNVQLEYRYVDEDGVVTWRRLSEALASASVNFAVFWDTTELIERLLFVDGSSNIYDWSGGVTTMASATVNTITKNGSETWAQDGFYTTGTRQVTINGAVYTYTGGENTTTLTGVTPDPSGEVADSIVVQTIRTTANSSMTAIPATFANSLIEVFQNQVFLGSLVNHSVYVSQQNSFTNYTVASPRTPGSGMLITLDAPPQAFIPQEESMYISAGREFWYQISLQLSADQTDEAVVIQRLKTTAQEGAQSQALTSKIKNSVVFVSYEPTLNTLGRLELVQTPQTDNISDPIKLDFDFYDFTGGSVAYFQYFIYIAIPAQGIVRMFNMAEQHWEAPQILPIQRFAIIDGELYGHSSAASETYKLFTGTSDNGNSIDGVARFSYQNFGKRANKKHMTEWYTEGYISSNTDLNVRILRDYEGSEGVQTYVIAGEDDRIIFDLTSDGSLGKQSLGKRSLAGRGATQDQILPPKFRHIKGLTGEDFYEMQVEYSTNDIDQVWEIIATGTDAELSASNNASITQ